ncbi:MAG TPA: hypothetical protein VLF95_10000 [Vicinamibacteria bacterium]|nr:hypothetical protein [Vicinamibacteria bacterium]
MLIIQVVAALLLLLGSGLIFRALLEIDAPSRPRAAVRPRPRPHDPESEVDLPRAA